MYLQETPTAPIRGFILH